MATTLSSNYWTATAAASTSASVLAVDTTTKTHVPGYKLPLEERMKKFDTHKFGLCVSCDAGLDDYDDFERDPVTFTPGLMCHDCIHYYKKDCVHYYNKAGYVGRGYDPMTPGAKELSALITGAWYPESSQCCPCWGLFLNFEDQWALADTPQKRAMLLAFYSPNASPTLTQYQRSILMDVTLPATKSVNPDAELTFCDGTLCSRVCDFAYCVEDTLDGEGYWYCDACRNFADQQDED
jgi:hypothetical protein